MRQRHGPPEEDDEEEDSTEEDEPFDDEEAPRRSGKRRRPEPRRGSVRPWSGDASDSGGATDEDDEAVGRDWLGRPKRPVFWRARDSLWFEPLVALAIVCLLIVGLWTYTQNWPPMYVVESDSMQHGLADHVGLLNTGDLVLAQQVSVGSITTYMEGLQRGYSTYGEFGDVVLYHPNGDTGATPIIHRPLVYLVHNPDATWSVPELAGLACSLTSHPYYSISTTPTQCGTSHILGTLTLYNVGWQSATVSIPLGQMGSASGFVTMGDNNYVAGAPTVGRPDQTGGVSALVQNDWVLGVARGMIPWFGAVKLLLQGQASMVPVQSWEWMGLALAGILLIGLGAHLALKSRPTEGEAEEEHLGWGERMRGWFRSAPEEDEVDEERRVGHRAEPNRIRSVRPIPKHDLLRRVHQSGGRPRPTVRRSGRPAKHRRPDDERSL